MALLFIGTAILLSMALYSKERNVKSNAECLRIIWALRSCYYVIP